MTLYMEGLRAKFKNVKPRPNQHVAFHIYDFLLLFGPVVSWWSFPFERIIGELQRMPSNHKIGEFSPDRGICRKLTSFCRRDEFDCPQSFRAGF